MYKLKIEEYHYHGGLETDRRYEVKTVSDVINKIIHHLPDYRLISMYGILVYINENLVYNSFLDKDITLIELAKRIEKGGNR